MNGLRSIHRGIALVLVLWVVVLLTIIAFGLTASQRTETALAANQLASARFRSAAEAGVNWAVLNLLAPSIVSDEEMEVWVPDGSAHFWIFAGENLEIRVFNEASRIDLNTADRDLLVALLRAVELPEDQVNALADAIEDWRDANDLQELNGAEDGDYENAGRSYGAKDGPFDSVQELQLVMGFDRDLYRILAPALTVSSGEDEPNREFAPPLVEAALQRITLAEAELEREEQAAATIANGSHVVTARGGPLYRIRVTRLVEEGAGQSMEALVRIQAGSVPPFSILWRRFGLVNEGPVALVGEG